MKPITRNSLFILVVFLKQKVIIGEARDVYLLHLLIQHLLQLLDV